MPLTGDEIYKTQEDILANLLANLQTLIPDLWVSEDGVVRLIFEVEAGQFEALYLAVQVLLEDMFIPSASITALQRFGDMYGYPQKSGNPALGNLLFTGAGGTYIPLNSEVAYDPGGGADVLFYTTTLDGTIPAPGTPMAPTIADGGSAGNLTGTFEYAVSFLTAQGETLKSADSNPVTVASKRIAVTNIPIGGPGTTGRRIYRMKNGGNYALVTTINDNSQQSFTDNIADGSLPGGTPVATSTAERVLLPAASTEPGTVFNAVPGTIIVLSDVPDGLTAVINPASFVGGTDTEETEDYRARLLTAIRSPGSGSIYDLQAWALNTDGVESATVFPNDNVGTPTPGHVTIRIQGPGGTVPPQSVLDAVAAAIAALDLANITVHIATFTAVPTDVTVTITPTTGTIVADITPSIVDAISEYIKDVPVGGTLYVSGIIDAVFGLPGVATVAVTTPGGDLTTAATSKRVPGAITVN